MAESSSPASSLVIRATALIAVAALGWFFPLFHVARLTPPGAAPTGSAGFNARTAAQRIWANDLPAAFTRAKDLAAVVAAIRADPAAAKQAHARAAGLDTAYYFVRGGGRVVARERNSLRIAVTGAGGDTIALRIGPVFGNTVRDGCGILDLNAFPSLEDYNALAAELNALVEQDVQPALRARAQPGSVVEFIGCAVAPDDAAGAGEPILTIVPVRAEVR